MSIFNKPYVSIVVAARNEEVHVLEALTSILEQKGLSFELIFVDDNSTDNTLEIVRELAKKFISLQVIQNPGKGKCSAFNYGVSMATGHFVCIFAADDIMPADSMVTRWEAVKDLPLTKPVVGLSKLLTMSETPRFDGHLVPKLPGRGALSGVSPLMNMLAVKAIFPVPEDLPNEDTWMELAVMYLDGWVVVHSDVICCRWRVHSGNSINLALPFDEFNSRITIRMSALKKFREKFDAQLSVQGKRDLDARIICEAHRSRGEILGILTSKVRFVDKLRAISQCNSMMYALRGRLYGLLSGW
jgi:glycosyltransferase involved in cell wall biosynthesis